MEIKDKIFVVTGAGSGIGKELVLGLLERGAKVAAIDIREESLKELEASVGSNSKNITTYVVDISDKRAVEALPAKVIANQGNIDSIINNAGIIQPFVRVNDLSYEDIDKVMNINFYGALYMVKAFLPILLKRPVAHIVNVSSMGGFLPVPGQSVYGASKAAVKLLTEGLYAELIDTNVQVTVVFPGATKTNITENSGVSGPKQAESSSEKQNFPMSSAEKAAETIIRGIEKNAPQVFIGKDCKFMNLLYRFNPVFATKFIANKMKSLLP